MTTQKMEKTLAKLANGAQVTIVALGDSNTELTFHTRGHLNWPYLLQEALYEKYGPNKVIMINAGCCGEGAQQAVNRIDRDVLRFKPDLVIICFWDQDVNNLRSIVTRIRRESDAEVLLRTPNPYVAPNMPAVDPTVVAGNEWPDTFVGDVADRIISLGRELDVVVVDHYHTWLKADVLHAGPPVSDPVRLWLRMPDVSHPGPAGHLAFYRELAPCFDLPAKLSWEF
jgi:lysophospholipase L1-like esterase